MMGWSLGGQASSKLVMTLIVFRIRNKPRMELVEELFLSEADRAAGVIWQGMVRLGDKWQGKPIRVVKVEVD